ncbi:hypothetical protein TRICI_004217 [Trichomonascus ciferrii]|uniref:Uncharacterized protein n=1 Tax=Trichomonascus ciferrii TaxID=44093 RepID=A0A642V1I9_9ASCO|nr:hypothetical protein TRICI_004217 [Trichomonascus ciferrii]
MDNYESVVSEVVFGEKQAVRNYPGCCINVQIRCLWSFYDKNKDSLDITYAIAGVKHVENAQPPVKEDLEPSEQNSQPKNEPVQVEVHDIVLAGKDQLEEASNTATRKLDCEMECTERFTKLGLIRNTWIGDDELKNLKSTAIPQSKDAAAAKDTAEKPKVSTEPAKQVGSKQQQQQKPTNRLADLFKNAPPKKTAEEKETTISDNHDDTHGDEDVKMEDAPRKKMSQSERLQKQAELQRMFDDDDEEEEEEENAKADEDEEMADADINLELDVDKEKGKEKEQSDKQAEKPKTNEEKPAEKKQEKKPPAPKKPPAQSKQGKKGKQTTLQSFFKKG